VLTFADTWAPGEPRAISLPVECAAGKWRAFRLATGPIPAAGSVAAHIGIEDVSEVVMMKTLIFELTEKPASRLAQSTRRNPSRILRVSDLRFHGLS
jgi:hypothetical protein